MVEARAVVLYPPNDFLVGVILSQVGFKQLNAGVDIIDGVAQVMCKSGGVISQHGSVFQMLIQRLIMLIFADVIDDDLDPDQGILHVHRQNMRQSWKSLAVSAVEGHFANIVGGDAFAGFFEGW
ncbi:hypothetical protein SDC9_104299 [bioreactor metagenome]|uniref:Uncharacterized protein n=1 Tax=bioreactor metagenome TaxID=1076179 RepID=A0A645AWE8_9ZZZZ